jgi:hypothetical protein
LARVHIKHAIEGKGSKRFFRLRKLSVYTTPLTTTPKGTYIQTASIFRLELDNRLAAELDLGAVLRPEPRHDLDTVRHDRETCVILERSYVQKVRLESNVVGVVKMLLAGDKEVDGLLTQVA